MEYRGKTVVITGGGSGLGAAMADVFATNGAGLALLDIDGDRAEKKAAELQAKGTDAIAMTVDVADKGSVVTAAREVEAHFGSCDVVCPNVGVQQFGAIDKLTDNDWAWVHTVNVMGVINTVSAFLPLVRKSSGDSRHILLTASASCFTPGARMAAYVATKYAVVGYGEVLRMELAEEGINVSMIFPAGMTTRHLESSRAARPAALGESKLDREDVEVMMASSNISVDTHLASAEHAVRNLLSELRAKQPYIITHGSYRAQVEEQQRKVLDAFDRMLANP
ncbi:MAG: SDR family NAD(P)-dependent oxidoreductase [Halioglobus sp.]|nr:SDR family NAD(P)-dependent oxidoreductase [Halioglobus sp.]